MLFVDITGCLNMIYRCFVWQHGLKQSESESDNPTEGVVWKARDLWSAPVERSRDCKHASLIVYAVFGKDLRRASSSRRRLRFLRQAACRHQWLRRRLIIAWAATACLAPLRIHNTARAQREDTRFPCGAFTSMLWVARNEFHLGTTSLDGPLTLTSTGQRGCIGLCASH